MAHEVPIHSVRGMQHYRTHAVFRTCHVAPMRSVGTIEKASKPLWAGSGSIFYRAQSLADVCVEFEFLAAISSSVAEKTLSL